MLIKRDFDQLKEILSDPESAEELIAYKHPFDIFKFRKVDIKNITENEITGTYTYSRYHYQISFSRNKNNQIEYKIKNRGYWLLVIFIIFVLYKNQHSNSYLLLGGICTIFLIIFLVNNTVKIGIAKRIDEGWGNFKKRID